MTWLEWTHKCSKRNSVINIQDFPARNASGRASIALRRSAKAVPACWRWSPPASCTCTCSAAVDAILHSCKNAQVVILDNDRLLSWKTTCKCTLCIGYRLRWRSDTWRTDRGVAEVRSPGIRPATDDDIRHNAPGLLKRLTSFYALKYAKKLLNQDKPSRLASYALQQHKAKFARLATSEFSFLLAVLRRSGWVRAVEQAWDENFETSASDGRAWYRADC